MKLSEPQIQSLLDQHLRQSLNEDDLLKELKVTPDNKSKNYKKLCRELLKVNIRVLDITKKRAVGDYSDQFSGGRLGLSHLKSFEIKGRYLASLTCLLYGIAH